MPEPRTPVSSMCVYPAVNPQQGSKEKKEEESTKVQIMVITIKGLKREAKFYLVYAGERTWSVRSKQVWQASTGEPSQRCLGMLFC